MERQKDYYDILGVSRDASAEEIKSSYRKLALKWHPDRNRDNREEAEKRMREINEAYSTLGDKQKREQYNRFGNSQEFAGFDQGQSEGFWGDSSPFEEIFSSFSSFFNEKKEERKEKKGQDISLEVPLTFREYIFGSKKKIILKVKRACVKCKQTGADSPSDIFSCQHCSGRGIISSVQKSILGYVRTQSVCGRCQGSGKIIKKICSQCAGKKLIWKTIEETLNVPRGIRVEVEYKCSKLGNDSKTFGEPRGGVIVKFQLRDNPYFKRKKNDIHVKVPVSFFEAALGATVEVITLEGTETVTLPAGTQTDDHITISNRGCYTGLNKNERGNLIVWWEVRVPEKINEEIKKTLKKIKEELKWEPNKEFKEKYKNIIDY